MTSTLEYLESKQKLEKNSDDDGLSIDNKLEFLMKKLVYESESNISVKFNKKIDLVEKSLADQLDNRCRKIEKKIMGKSGYTCVRRTFCWLNVILWLCGCAFLGAGIWLRLVYRGYATLLPDHDGLSADALFIGIGVLSFVVSFFGCCGAWFQSRCLLITYFILIVLLFLSEFLIGSIAFLFRGGLGRTLANELRFGIEKHYNASDRGGLAAPSIAAIWDTVQQSMECCGVTSYEDWYDINAWEDKRWVPDSCCKNMYERAILTEGSGDNTASIGAKVECGKSGNPGLWFDKGCAHSLQIWFAQRLHIVGSVGLVIAFLQLFGLITSMLLFCTVKHKRESQTYKSYSPSIDPATRTSSWED